MSKPIMLSGRGAYGDVQIIVESYGEDYSRDMMNYLQMILEATKKSKLKHESTESRRGRKIV